MSIVELVHYMRASLDVADFERWVVLLWELWRDKCDFQHQRHDSIGLDQRGREPLFHPASVDSFYHNFK